MSVIKFHRLFMADAEEVMAEVWNCLEEYEIPSPYLGFQFDGRGRVTLHFQFDDPGRADMVALRLSEWMPTGHRSAAARTGGHSLRWPSQFLARAHAGGRRQPDLGPAASFSLSPLFRAH